MENQHRKITGYRDLTQAEIDLMNEIKAAGQILEPLCDKVRAHIIAQYQAANHAAATEETDRLNRAQPETWEAGAAATSNRG